MVLEYKPVKYYKKFKRDYLQFVVFVKCGAFYYTFDSDAKIMVYVCNYALNEDGSIKIKKEEFFSILKILHQNELNVILAGSKNVSEYYTDKQSQYMKVRARAKAHVRATISGVQ